MNVVVHAQRGQSTAPHQAQDHDEAWVAELGSASWKVMHAIAEQFPAVPSLEQKQAALLFLRSFSILYPCEKCRLHFQALLQKYKPEVHTRDAFIEWMCFFHDQVNITLGKETHKRQ